MDYRIHTNATKYNLISPELTSTQVAYTYANEAWKVITLFRLVGEEAKETNGTALAVGSTTITNIGNNLL